MTELKSCLKRASRNTHHDLETIQTSQPKPKIPALHSIAPAIFVPITQNLLAAPPQNSELDQAKRTLKDFNEYSAAVRDNILRLCHQESRRIYQETLDRCAQLKANGVKDPELPSTIPGWEPSEEDIEEMVKKLAVESYSRDKYHTAIIPEIDFTAINALPEGSPGESYTKSLLNIIGNCCVELRGYDRYVYRRRTELEQQIQQLEGTPFNPPTGPRAHRG